MSDDYCETAKRLHDIKRRIAELREALHTSRPEPAYRHDEVSQAPRDVEKAQEKRNAELDDIKAKLLGRKK